MKLGGGFKHFLCSPLPGEMMKFDSYFFKWVVSILAQADVFSKLATENRGDMKKIKK